jgi:two-component system LytT family response regulator
MKQKQILLNGNRQKLLIAINDIVLIKADNVYSYVFLANGSSLLVSDTISNIELQISSNVFYRTHRSYLLNLNFMDIYRKSDKKVLVKHHELVVPIARDKCKDFEHALNKLFLVKK